MAKKKVAKSFSGRISLYSSKYDGQASASRSYISISDRNKTIRHWIKLYQLDKLGHYIIQIRPNVN